MSEYIGRYTIVTDGAHVVDDKDGAFVYYDDHVAREAELRADNERLRLACAQWRKDHELAIDRAGSLNIRAEKAEQRIAELTEECRRWENTYSDAEYVTAEQQKRIRELEAAGAQAEPSVPVSRLRELVEISRGEKRNGYGVPAWLCPLESLIASSEKSYE